VLYYNIISNNKNLGGRTMAELSKGNSSIKGSVQRFGAFLSGMVLPNIGAFIAWGLITALFIPTGWFPNEALAKLVNPMVTYMIPLLIGYQGGKLVYGTRGGVVGAIATAGIIIGASIPMFLGAMIMGPLGGFIIKKFDKLVEGKVPTGFEMLVNNFSAGILGGALSIVAFQFIEPVVAGVSIGLGIGAKIITQHGLLPLIAIIVEPAKILFLNNAINHGVFSPLGIQQVSTAGKSIFFLLEPNPGPGLGVLLAYCLYSKGAAKQSAPGAAIIHFLGGIHEIYFPYVLMKPILLLAVIAGGMSADLIFVLSHAGLVAASSPGSIFALLALSPKGGQLSVVAGVAVGAAVSFIVSSIILKKSKQEEGSDFDEAQGKIKEMKTSGKSQSTSTREGSIAAISQDVKLIVFACDAGMGSSAMGESILRKALKDAGISDIDVKHSSVDSIPTGADVVFTQENLVERAKKSAESSRIITIKNFLDRSKYDEFINEIKLAGKGQISSQLTSENSAAVSQDVKLIVFACDAGMGSSAMGESILRKALKDAGISDIDVKHSSVDSIPAGADVVFTQENLMERAKKSAKSSRIITIKNFLDRSKYDDFISELKK
jgi:PTS system mannitol-specific IIC component